MFHAGFFVFDAVPVLPGPADAGRSPAPGLPAPLATAPTAPGAAKRFIWNMHGRGPSSPCMARKSTSRASASAASSRSRSLRRSVSLWHQQRSCWSHEEGSMGWGSGSGPVLCLLSPCAPLLPSPHLPYLSCSAVSKSTWEAMC